MSSHKIQNTHTFRTQPDTRLSHTSQVSHTALAVDHHGEHAATQRQLRHGGELLATVAVHHVVLGLVARAIQGAEGLGVGHGQVVVQQRRQQGLLNRR